MANELQGFVDDDTGYRSWLFSHLGSYVVNAERRPSASYLVLHKAPCDSIMPVLDRCFTCDYIRFSESRMKLDVWAHETFGAFATPCGRPGGFLGSRCRTRAQRIRAAIALVRAGRSSQSLRLHYFRSSNRLGLRSTQGAGLARVREDSGNAD